MGRCVVDLCRGESVRIGDAVVVTYPDVVRNGRSRVRIAIEAPREMRIVMEGDKRVQGQWAVGSGVPESEAPREWIGVIQHGERGERGERGEDAHESGVQSPDPETRSASASSADSALKSDSQVKSGGGA